MWHREAECYVGEVRELRDHIAIVVLAALLIVPLIGAAAHTPGPPLDLVLTSQDHDGAPGGPKGMLAEDHGEGSVIELTPVKACQLWVSDRMFEISTSFPAQTVEYQLNTMVGHFTSLTVSLGVVSANVYTPAAETTGEGPDSTIYLADGLTAEAGESIGFQVCADFVGTAMAVDISTHDGSSLVSFTDYPPPVYTGS